MCPARRRSSSAPPARISASRATTRWPRRSTARSTSSRRTSPASGTATSSASAPTSSTPYFDGWDYAGSNGTFTFNGTITGLALADFLTGQMSNFGHGSPNVNTNHQWYLGVYGQDTWRVGNKVTLNLGLRWDPYFGTVWQERHDLELLDRQLPRRHPQHQLPERAGRSALPW